MGVPRGGKEAPVLDPDDPDRLRLAMQGTRLGLWDWDMVTGQTVFNERWAEIIGYRLEELEPTTIETWAEHAVPEDLEASNQAIAAHASGETDFYDVEVRMKHRDGHTVWVHDRGRIVEWLPDGSPARMVGTHEDITTRVERETALNEARTVFDNSKEGIVILNADEAIRSVNPAFTMITGWKPEQVIGKPFDDIRTHAEDTAETERLRASARTEQGVRVQRDLFRPDGSTVPVLMSINRSLDPHGHVGGFIAQLSDLSDHVRAEQDRMDRVLFIDETTGLLNARGFRQRFALELQRFSEANGRRGLMLVSLDNLGSVREAFGYEGAELVVSIIANRLRETVGDEGRLARFGRDDFAILLVACASREHAEATARSLLESVANVCQVPGTGNVFVTASAGLTMISSDSEPVDQVIRQATAALNLSKKKGSGSIHFHEPGLLAEARERVLLVTQIRQAWERREFHLEYQPINAVNGGELVGVEALMRWNSPELGIVTPNEFIPLAEESGLIVELGNWAIAEATAECQRFRDRGLDINMSVNVTVQQLMSANFVDVVESSLRDADLPGSRLILEMTESALLHSTGSTLELLARLEALGVRIAIDDFGTGYSSFAYLHQYPLDRLKIDRSFIRGLTERAAARSIVAAMIDLGHHLGLKVVAEGVELEEQRKILHELGCDLYQGFLRSPAIPAPDLIEMASGA